MKHPRESGSQRTPSSSNDDLILQETQNRIHSNLCRVPAVVQASCYALSQKKQARHWPDKGLSLNAFFPGFKYPLSALQVQKTTAEEVLASSFSGTQGKVHLCASIQHASCVQRRRRIWSNLAVSVFIPPLPLLLSKLPSKLIQVFKHFWKWILVLKLLRVFLDHG